MRECTQEWQPEVLESIGEALKAKQQGEVDWIPAITCNIDVLPEELKGESEISRRLTSQDIRNAQLSDPVICRVHELNERKFVVA